METRAYCDNYLEDAQYTMGNMMDYALNICGINGDEFFHMFLASGIAEQFGRGNPRYISGMTGAEVAKEAVADVKGIELTQPEEYFLDKSPEFWCGWILAYYQWRSCMSFKRIYQFITIEDLLCMYPTHHEADEEYFVDSMNEIYKTKHMETYVKQRMKNLGIDAREVSRHTGIPVEVVSELESDFSKIKSIMTQQLFHLANFFGCAMEDLMEY